MKKPLKIIGIILIVAVIAWLMLGVIMGTLHERERDAKSTFSECQNTENGEIIYRIMRCEIDTCSDTLYDKDGGFIERVYTGAFEKAEDRAQIQFAGCQEIDKKIIKSKIN